MCWRGRIESANEIVSREWSVVSEKVFKLSTLRHALCLVGAVLIALCSSVKSQQTGRVYRLGFLSPASSPDPSIPTTATLVPNLLGDSGYVEGRNLQVQRRFAEGKLDRLPQTGQGVGRFCEWT